MSTKLKKSFHHDIIDYRPADARRRCCEQDFCLNQRLAADVYPGVVPLTCDRAGALAFAGHARRIDSLVKMRRLDPHSTLEYRVRNRLFGAEDARHIIARLVPFFAEAERSRRIPAGDERHLISLIRIDAQEQSRREFGLDRQRVRGGATRLLAGIKSNGALLRARARAGRIVEGHADLRPEHVHPTRRLGPC